MNRQSGFTLTGLIGWSFVVVFGALLAFKVIPPYMEYLNIKKNLDAVANDPAMQEAAASEFRSAFSRRAGVDNITVIEPADVNVAKEGNRVVLSAQYSVKVPLVANVSLLLEFRPTSSR